MSDFKKYLTKYTVVFILLSSPVMTVYAGEHVLSPTFGSVELDTNTNHLVDTNSFDFDDNGDGAVGFTYLYQLDNGFAFGADIFGYEKDIVRTVNNRGDASITHVYGVIQKFFLPEGTVKPYIGIGAGYAGIQFDANINGAIADDHDDIAFGFSHEIFAGVEFTVSDRVGIKLEYKQFSIDIDEDIGLRDIDVDTDGDGFFAGVSIRI